MYIQYMKWHSCKVKSRKAQTCCNGQYEQNKAQSKQLCRFFLFLSVPAVSHTRMCLYYVLRNTEGELRRTKRSSIIIFSTLSLHTISRSIRQPPLDSANTCTSWSSAGDGRLRIVTTESMTTTLHKHNP